MKVIALGGSVLTAKLDELDEIADAVTGREQVVVVTGAGTLKSHIEAVKDSANQAEQDMVGIAATRLNAKTLQTVMENSYPGIPETPRELQQAVSTGKNVVMGGITPGYSTDAVAATAAELFDGELVIATSVDGVYTDDPEKTEAEKYDEITASELIELVKGNNRAGGHALIDGTALEIVKRSGIPMKVIEGKVENLADTESADGTTVLPE